MIFAQEDAAVAAGAAILGGSALVLFLASVCVLLAVLFFEAIPAVIAVARGHPDTMAITAVTMLFGWSLLGWGIALIWALKSFPPDRYDRRY